jgi:hypothetical protein
MNLLSILAIAAVAVSSAGECCYPFSHSSQILIDIDPLFSSSSSLLHSLRRHVCLIHHIYLAESAFAATIAATDADDVAIMSIESEGNFNQAMVTMLRGHGTADGVVSLRNNKDMSDDHCKDYPCSSYKDCCEYE